VARRAEGRKTRSSAPTPTTLPIACPDGKLALAACATGWASNGRWRPTAALTVLLSSPPPTTVTTSHAARRGRRRMPSQTATATAMTWNTAGCPTVLIAFKTVT